MTDSGFLPNSVFVAPEHHLIKTECMSVPLPSLSPCNCISNTVKTIFLNIVHAIQCHLQLLEESEFYLPICVCILC